MSLWSSSKIQSKLDEKVDNTNINSIVDMRLAMYDGNSTHVIYVNSTTVHTDGIVVQTDGTPVAAVQQTTLNIEGDGVEVTSDNGVSTITIRGFKIDSQKSNGIGEEYTTSDTFVNIPDMYLTSSNTSPTDYIINFSGVIKASKINTILHVTLTLNGMEMISSERKIKVKHTNSDMSFSTNCIFQNVSPGSSIKAKYKITGSDSSNDKFYISERIITAYGVY